MKENYACWDISLKDFPESGSLQDKVRFLLGFAILAPSAHNTQPWAFSIEDSRLSVFGVADRKLDASDKFSREYFISLGCCLENIAIALDAFRVPYSFSLFPDGIGGNPIGRFTLGSSLFQLDAARQSELLQAIIRRISNRSTHVVDAGNRALVERVVQDFRKTELSDIHLSMFFEPESIKHIASLSFAGTCQVMGQRDFRHELSHWVKPNSTTSGLGMPGFILGAPDGVSSIFPFIVRHINPGKKSLRKEFQGFFEATQAVGVFTSQHCSPLDWVLVGRNFERLALRATLHGLAISVYAASIEVPSQAAQLRSFLGGGEWPHMVFRVGVATEQARRTPRLSVSECLLTI